MRTITLGGGELLIAATPMTPWIYKKAFGADMISDVAGMTDAISGDGTVDVGRIGLFGLVQMAWAMAKTVNPKLADFDAWLGSLPDDALDFTTFDAEGVINEVMRGFFRSGTDDAAKKEVQGAGAEPVGGGTSGAGDTGSGEADAPVV